MAKKIKLELKNINNLEFTLLENAESGDYVSLKEVEQVSFDKLLSELKDKKDDLIKDIWEKEKDSLLRNSEEFNELKENLQAETNKLRDLKSNKDLEIVELRKDIIAKENEIQSRIDLEKQKLNSDWMTKVKDLENEIVNKDAIMKSKINEEVSQAKLDLEKELEKLKANEMSLSNKIKEDKLNYESRMNDLKEHFESKESSIKEIAIRDEAEKYKDEINNLKNEISKKEVVINSANSNFELRLKNSLYEKERELETKYNEIIKEKDEEFNKLEMRRNLLNIKEIGEDLERWMTSEASNYLSYPNTSHKKANQTIDNTKPDFIFEIFNDDGSILSSVTIEAKSETLNAKTKKHNNEHIEKLDSDRRKNNTEYALLVTELEKEDDFIFKRVGEYKDMYMVRPKYYVPFLQLIYNLTLKRKEIDEIQIDFKEKQDILREFEEFKNDILEVTMSKINSNFEDIQKEANKVLTSAEKIISKTRTAEGHLSTLENKFNKFKINKLVDKI